VGRGAVIRCPVPALQVYPQAPAKIIIAILVGWGDARRKAAAAAAGGVAVAELSIGPCRNFLECFGPLSPFPMPEQLRSYLHHVHAQLLQGRVLQTRSVTYELLTAGEKGWAGLGWMAGT
jgi:hypothetical protein